MKKFLLLLSFIVVIHSLAQTSPERYSTLVKTADSLYNAKNYKASAFTYSDAFKANDWTGTVNDRYNAACSWALANYPDSAFSNLQNIVTNAHYFNYEHISTDADLKNLYKDKRWRPLLAMVKQNKARAEANFNKPLMDELTQVLKDD